MLATIKKSMIGIAAAALLSVGIPASAQADPVTVVACALGTYSIRYDPGIKLLVPQDITTTVAYNFSNCVSSTDPRISSGTANFSNLAHALTCADLAKPVRTTFSISWNTGETSTVDVTNLLVGPTVVVTGSVKSGSFADKTITIALQSFPVEAILDCPTSGLTLITGTTTLGII